MLCKNLLTNIDFMFNKHLIIALTICIGIFTQFPVCHADDLDPHYKYSAVKPPQSPYKNIWNSFQTDIHSGSFVYAYKIAIPLGTKGLTPQISISYNSHSAKGKAGWVGFGWDISLSYIQRDIEYTRKDTTDDTFDLLLEGAKHDLVYVSSENLFHTKLEAYLRIEKKTGAPNTTGEYWVVQSKDGTEFRFGYNADSENMVNSSDGSVPSYVWRWSLDRIKDRNGNSIFFTYEENPAPNDRGAVYLSKIEYSNDKKRVIEFILEGSDRPDTYMIIDQGSEVVESRRLAEILITVDGSRARKYLLNYSMNEIQNKSLLTSITQYGSDGITSLPPVTFEYKPIDTSFGSVINWPTPDENWIRQVDYDNDVITDTFDVNGDGLPDLISADPPLSPTHWDIWFNNGSGFTSPNTEWNIPNTPEEGSWDIRDVISYIPDVQSPDTRSNPIDINRDGYIDFLFVHEDTTLQIQENTGNRFMPAPSWPLPLQFSIREVQQPDTKAANVQQTLLDINGDGLPDIVSKEGGTAWHIWRNTGNGFTDFGVWSVPTPNAWIEDFTEGVAYTEVALYDLNGDGLPDIVDGRGPSWDIYLNTGSNFIHAGQWYTTYSGYITDPDTTGNIKRDLIDINGDGLPDIVDPNPGTGEWEVYFNKGNGFSAQMSWSTLFTDGYTRDVESGTGNVKRDVFDIDGDGLPDIVRRDSSPHWDVYRNNSGRANLLTRVTDILGGSITAA